MTGVVDSQHAHKAVVTQIETRDAAVCGGDPDGLQVGGVERAHQVKYQNADGSGMRKENNAPALV